VLKRLGRERLTALPALLTSKLWSSPMYDLNLILSRHDHQDIENRFRARFVVGEPDACWPWLGSTLKPGYGKMTIFDKQTALAHRLAYLFEYRRFPMLTEDGKRACACHHCDNMLCVNPTHLFVGSQIDNIRDRHTKGRSKGGVNPGELSGHNKLTDSQVVEILSSAGSNAVVARRYGVSAGTIRLIRLGETWRHVPHPLRTLV